MEILLPVALMCLVVFLRSRIEKTDKDTFDDIYHPQDHTSPFYITSASLFEQFTGWFYNPEQTRYGNIPFPSLSSLSLSLAAKAHSETHTPFEPSLLGKGRPTHAFAEVRRAQGAMECCAYEDYLLGISFPLGKKDPLADEFIDWIEDTYYFPRQSWMIFDGSSDFKDYINDDDYADTLPSIACC